MSLIKNTYIANGIQVLKFSKEPDEKGIIIPPEAHVTYPKSIDITYGEGENELKAGKATFRRVGNYLLADMVLKSSMKDFQKVISMISKMTPAVSFYVDENVGNTIFKLEICELFLTTYRNDSKYIKPIGNRVSLLPNKKDLH